MATTQKSAKTETRNGRKPAHTLSRYARGKYLQVSIWENESDGRLWFSVKVNVRYQDDGEWQDQNGLDEEHLLSMANLLTQADQWCQERRKDTAASN